MLVGIHKMTKNELWWIKFSLYFERFLCRIYEKKFCSLYMMKQVLIVVYWTLFLMIIFLSISVDVCASNNNRFCRSILKTTRTRTVYNNCNCPSNSPSYHQCDTIWRLINKHPCENSQLVKPPGKILIFKETTLSLSSCFYYFF